MTSDQPLKPPQQNESRPVVNATPAPQQNMMSRSPTNTITNTNTNTNQVQETLPFRSPRSIAPSTNPDSQTIQELRRTERVYHRQIQDELQEINVTVPQAINTEEDIVSVLSPPPISNSASVSLEPEETSVAHDSTSPRRLSANVTTRTRRSTRDPDEIGGSKSDKSRSGGIFGNIPQTPLPEKRPV